VNLRVTVVEDDDHYRGSLEILLALEPGFELAGQPQPIVHVLRNGWRSAPMIFRTSRVPRQAGTDS